MTTFQSIMMKASDGASVIPEAVRAWLEPTLISLMAIMGLAIIILVLIQKGTTESGGAVTGQTETYLGKNKSDTIERKLKIATFVMLGLVLINSIIYFVIAQI